MTLMIFHKCPNLNILYQDIENNNLSSLPNYTSLLEKDSQSKCVAECKSFIISEYLCYRSHNKATNENENGVGLDMLTDFLKSSCIRIRYSAFLFFIKYYGDRNVICFFLNDSDERIRSLAVQCLPIEGLDVYNLLGDKVEVRKIILMKIEKYLEHFLKHSGALEQKRLKTSGFGIISHKIFVKIFSCIHDSNVQVRILVSQIISLPLEFDPTLLLIRGDFGCGAVSYGLEDENYLVRRNMLKFIFREVDKGNEDAIEILFESFLDENLKNRTLICEKIGSLTVQYDSFRVEKYSTDKYSMPVWPFITRQKNLSPCFISRINNLSLSEEEKYYLVRMFVKENLEIFYSIFTPEKIGRIKTLSELRQLIVENSGLFGIKRPSRIHLCSFIIIIRELVAKYNLDGDINQIILENLPPSSKKIFLVDIMDHMNSKFKTLFLDFVKKNNDLANLKMFLDNELCSPTTKGLKLTENEDPNDFLLKRFAFFFASLSRKYNIEGVFEKLNFKFRYSMGCFPSKKYDLSLYDYLKSIDYKNISELDMIYRIIALPKNGFIVLKISNFKFRLTKPENMFNFLNSYKDVDFSKSFYENIYYHYGFGSYIPLSGNTFKFNELYKLKVKYSDRIYYLDLNANMIIKLCEISNGNIYSSLVIKDDHEISITDDKLVKFLK